MGNRVKKGTSLSNTFLIYVMLVLVTNAVIAGCAVIIVLFSFANEYVLPASYEENQIKEAAETIITAEEITDDMIPELCEYVVFDQNGAVKKSTMKPDQERAAWYRVESKQPYYSYNRNYYEEINRMDEICVIQYQLEPQFRSEELRQKIKHPEQLFVSTVILLVVAVTLGYSLLFGRRMKKKLQVIMEAAEQIENQNLDFSIRYGNVKEINKVLEAMEHMKAALNESLQQQWNMEENRRTQISSLAHDLKTPLTIIRGNSDLLCDMEPDADQAECLEYIKDSVDEMDSYIKELILVNKRTEEVAPEFSEHSAKSLCEKIKKQTEGLAKAKKIQPVIIYEWKRDTIRCDEELVIRAVMNIISNAIDYSPEGAKLTIAFEEKDEMMESVQNRSKRNRVDRKNMIQECGNPIVEDDSHGFSHRNCEGTEQLLQICVKDEGCGFSPEALKYATSQFFMEDKSRTGGNHHGIGLYEASHIAKLHHGDLVLENNSESGACVVFKMCC